MLRNGMNYHQLRQQAGGSLTFRGQTISGVTGTMAAALAADAAVCAFRYPVAAVAKCAVLWMHLHYVCIGAFTTPVTAGRRLHLIRGSGADPSGGTALDVSRDDSGLSAETKVTGAIATTAALTMTSVVFTSELPKARLLLAHAGASGASYDEVWRWEDPLVLLPGELLAVTAGATFDAAGTWQMNFKAEAVEF